MEGVIKRVRFERDFIAFDEIPALIGSIVAGYLANREPDESFVAVANRHSGEELKTMAAIAARTFTHLKNVQRIRCIAYRQLSLVINGINPVRLNHEQLNSRFSAVF